MKRNSLIMIFSFILLTVGCKVDEISRISPDGDFAVNFSLPEGVVYAPAKVVPVNRSKYSESFKWTFEGAKTINKEGQLLDVNTSTSLVPDTVFYRNPGTYKVTLEASQGGQVEIITKEINVVKMTPEIVHPEGLLAGRDLQFDVRAFEYEGQVSTYQWDFGLPGKTSTEKNPIIQYEEAGVYTVTLTVNDGEETFTVSKQIRVLGELVKTLYFTDVITKKIYKYRMTVLEEPFVENLGVSTGVHPLGMTIHNNRIFITEVGYGLTYSTGDFAKADGKVYSMDLSGNGEVVITNPPSTDNYQADPWLHTIDNNGNIWWTSRNNAVRVLPITAQNAPYPAAKIQLTAANLGQASASNHFDGGVQVVGNEVWLSKTGVAGTGIYKFNSTTGAFIGSLSPELENYAIRSFVVDVVNNKIYFSVNKSTATMKAGVYRADINGKNIIPIDTEVNNPAMAIGNFSNEGGAPNEHVYITSFALDTDGGYLYYPYRANSDISGAANAPVLGNGSNSGIKRYALDGSKTAEFIFKGYAPYAIAIDNVRR
ncbi:PKD domain-containing protein [Pseudoxanthomonas sp. SGD-10]|nr:PKD domain-containing protein [Pseudoxanthomonas sp. SGD-10]